MAPVVDPQGKSSAAALLRRSRDPTDIDAVAQVIVEAGRPAYTISPKAAASLAPKEMMKGAAMEAFFALLNAAYRDIHCFGTHVLTHAPRHWRTNDDDWERMRRDFRRVSREDMFMLRLAFFPMHDGNVHWGVACVYFEHQVVLFYEAWYNRATHTRWRQACARDVLALLQREWVMTSRMPEDFGEWSLITDPRPALPVQADGFSCGLFVCAFALAAANQTTTWLLPKGSNITPCRKYMAACFSAGRILPLAPVEQQAQLPPPPAKAGTAGVTQGGSPRKRTSYKAERADEQYLRRRL